MPISDEMRQRINELPHGRGEPLSPDEARRCSWHPPGTIPHDPTQGHKKVTVRFDRKLREFVRVDDPFC